MRTDRGTAGFLLRRGRRLGSAARETLLTSAAVAGVVCMLIAAAALFLDVRPLVFRSGSMSPAIETGALAVARSTPASGLARGDVVSVTNAAGTRITHRIEALTLSGEVATLVLRGDANRVADAETYVVTDADKVLFSVNRLGYLVAWLSSKVAVFLGGLLAGVLLVAAFGRNGGGRPGPEPPARRSTDERREPCLESPATGLHRTAGWVATAVAVAATAVGALLAGSVNTQAAWTDGPATATSGTFTTTTIPIPTNFRCVNGGLLSSAELRWTAASGMRYRITFTPNGGGTPTVVNLNTGSDSYALNSMSSGTATLRAVKDYPSTGWVSQSTAGVGYVRGLLGGMSCA